MHEDRVRRVYERRRLVTEPSCLLPTLNAGIKTQFPAQSGTVYAGPFFLRLSALFSFRTLRPTLLPLHRSPSLAGVFCLMKLSREGSLSFCSAATPLASSVVVSSRAVVSPASDFTRSLLVLFTTVANRPFPETLLVAGELTLFSCTSVFRARLHESPLASCAPSG